MTIGKSVKYKSVEVQLIRRRDDGGVQKAYLTAKACRTILSKENQVKLVAAVLSKQNDPNQNESASDIPIDDKKALTVKRRDGDTESIVVIETIKDGEKQPGLAFQLTEAEWQEMTRISSSIMEELMSLSATVYAELDKRIKVYRWTTVKTPENTVSNMGSRWEFFESDAQMEGDANVEAEEQVIIQYRMVTPPSRQRLYDVVKIYMLRNALCEIRKKSCHGCQRNPPASSQSDHMIGNGVGCLDDLVEVADDIYESAVLSLTPMTIAALYHAVASAIKLPTHGGETQEEMSSTEIRDIVLGGLDWEEIDIEYLCQKVNDSVKMNKAV